MSATGYRAAWNATVSHYPASHRLTPGEMRVIAEAWPQIRGRRVLDIGVGAGRTVPYLAYVSGTYVAVDAAPNMVAAARRQFPQVDIRLEDACAMDLPAEQFDFVLFSYNGIDCMDPEDRHRVLAEVYRVLRPGGVFAFSTHNKNTLPDDGITVPRSAPPFDSNPLRYAYRLARFVRGYHRARRNRQRLEHKQVWLDDIAFVVDGAHDSSVLMGYVKPAAQLRMLSELGFELPPRLLIDDHGVDADERSLAPWLYFLVRKPLA